MFTPRHNAYPFERRHRYYYLVNGNWDGSWEGLPKDVIIMNWSANPEGLKWFAERGHKQILCGYYDGDGRESNIRDWMTSFRGRSRRHRHDVYHLEGRLQQRPRVLPGAQGLPQRREKAVSSSAGMCPLSRWERVRVRGMVSGRALSRGADARGFAAICTRPQAGPFGRGPGEGNVWPDWRDRGHRPRAIAERAPDLRSALFRRRP